MTRGALPGVAVAEIDRVLKLAVFYRDRFALERLLGRYVTDVAFIADNLAVAAYVLAVMTTETTLSVEVADVVRMRAPVRFHLGEKVCLIDTLDLGDGGRDHFGFARINLRMRSFVIVVDRVRDRDNCLISAGIRLCQSLDGFCFYERQLDRELSGVERPVDGVIR